MVENNNNNFIHLDFIHQTEFKGNEIVNFCCFHKLYCLNQTYFYLTFNQSFQFKSNLSKFDISYFNILHILIKVIAYVHRNLDLEC